MQHIKFLFFTLVSWIGVLTAYVLVPFAVAYADEDGRLPWWGYWLETPDALGWGAGTYEPPIKECYDKYGKERALVCWLWRNPAYRLRFGMGVPNAELDYSKVVFEQSGTMNPPQWGFSLWRGWLTYNGKRYFDYRPRLSLGSFYVYLLIGWKLKPYFTGHFPTGPSATGMFSGIVPRSESLKDK